METIKKQSLVYFLFFACCLCTTKQQALTAVALADQDREWSNWKVAMRQEFLQDLTHVQNIVIQGETPQETEDFLRYFGQQIAWLDKTLTLAQNSTDASLDQLKQQKDLLENVVRVQKETEIILQDRLRNMIIESPRYAILRLMVLYEVNSLMQRAGSGDIAPSIASTLSDQQKKLIVDKILRKDAVHAKEQLVIQKEQFDQAKKLLQDKLDQVYDLLRKTQKESLDLDKDYSQKITAKTEENSKQEAKISAINQELAALKQDLKKSQQDFADLKVRAHDEHSQLLEAEEKGRLADELGILRSKQDNAHYKELLNGQKEQLNQAKKLLQDQKILQDKLDQVQDLLSKAQKEKLDLEKDYSQKITEKTEENAKQEARISTINREFAALKQDLKKSQQDFADLKIRAHDEHSQFLEVEEKSRLTDELSILRNKQDKAHYKELLNGQKEQLNKVEKLFQTKLDQAQALLQKIEEEKLSLKQEYEQKIATVEKDNGKQQATILAINEELKLFKQDLAKNQEELAHLKIDASDRQSQLIKTLDIQKGQFEQTEKLLQGKLDQAQALLEKAKQEKKAEQENFDKLIKASKASIQEKKDLNKEYAQKIAAITQENDKQQAKIVAINQELGALRQDLEKNLQHFTSLKAYARDQQKQRIEAELKVELTEDLARQRILQYLSPPSHSEKKNSQE